MFGSFNVNPKVVSAALTAALVGALSTALAAAQAPGATGLDTKTLLLAVGGGLVTGAASGLLGWLRSQGDWKPNA